MRNFLIFGLAVAIAALSALPPKGSDIDEHYAA
jgi:hypothetical protein